MSCEEALLLISGHIDNENTPEEEAQLQAHLETCEACRRVMHAFLEIDGALRAPEEVPAGLCDDVMNAIRAEVPVKTKKRRIWPTVAAAAAVALVIGVVGMPRFQMKKETDAAAPVTVQVTADQVAVADYSMETVEIELYSDEIVTYSAKTVMRLLPQDIADARGADVAVTRELLPEMEVCPCESLEDGSLLYHLETEDGAVQLSKIYGLELYQPTAYTGEGSYALLLAQ